jgi:phospholipid-binding lipoprotein MlaA
VRRVRPGIAALLLGLTLAATLPGCATPPDGSLPDPGPGAMDVWDPLEPMNRAIYRFNANFDKWIFLPALRGYRFIVPSFVRARFSDFRSNLGEVTTFANSVLQLKPMKATNTLARFLMNGTLGLGGLFDVATPSGLPSEDEDFGQTMARYGVPPGPYLFMPFLGPSSFRDGTGLLVDTAFTSYLQSLVIGDFLSEHPYVYLPIALQTRDDVSFRYGELGPFEYDFLRYLYTEYRDIQSAR